MARRVVMKALDRMFQRHLKRMETHLADPVLDDPDVLQKADALDRDGKILASLIAAAERMFKLDQAARQADASGHGDAKNDTTALKRRLAGRIERLVRRPNADVDRSDDAK